MCKFIYFFSTYINKLWKPFRTIKWNHYKNAIFDHFVRFFFILFLSIFFLFYSSSSWEKELMKSSHMWISIHILRKSIIHDFFIFLILFEILLIIQSSLFIYDIMIKKMWIKRNLMKPKQVPLKKAKKKPVSSRYYVYSHLKLFIFLDNVFQLWLWLCMVIVKWPKQTYIVVWRQGRILKGCNIDRQSNFNVF